MRIDAVLLAAGGGVRFGENKLLYEVDGLPLFERAARAADVAGIDNLWVVTRYSKIRESLLNRKLQNGARLSLLDNPGAGEGLASSVRIGTMAAQGADAIVFLVCDQPWLTAESVTRLLAAFRSSEKGMACLADGGRTGNPVVFSSRYAQELLELVGDVGGKAVLRRHTEDVLLVQAPALELLDMDVKDLQ